MSPRRRVLSKRRRPPAEKPVVSARRLFGFCLDGVSRRDTAHSAEMVYNRALCGHQEILARNARKAASVRLSGCLD